MRKKVHLSLIETSIILYCAVSSYKIIYMWQNTPHARLSFLAFAIWLAPALYYRYKTFNQPNTLFLLIGLALTTFGMIGSLNVAKHAGLGFALASLIPISPIQILWTLSFISWTPALGWFLKDFSPLQTFYIRLTIASIASIFITLYLINDAKK